MASPAELSATSTFFLDTVREWLQLRGEVLVLVRYSRAAGSRDWYLIRSTEQLQAVAAQSPETSILIFRDAELPVKGVAGPELATEGSRLFNGADDLIVLRLDADPARMRPTWQYAGSVTELEEILAYENMAGHPAAIGVEPPWTEDLDGVVEAVVPYPNDTVGRGIY